MKKIIISSLFLALMVLPGVQISHAQTVDTPATSAQVDALQQTLIKLLTEMIAQLQAQIAEILAQQAQTTTAIAEVNTKIEDQKLGAVTTNPVSTTARPNNPECIVVEPYTELNKIRVPLIVNGPWNEIKVIYDRKQVMSGYNAEGKAIIESPARQREEIIVSSNNFRTGEPWFEVYRYPEIYDVRISVDGKTFTNHVLEIRQCQI